MNKKRILIVGGSAAGPSAAAKAKRTNPNAEIIVFESTDTVSYGICEAPYAISGLISDENKLMIYSPKQLQEEKGITVKTLHKAENILSAKHKIIVRDICNHQAVEYEYDKLIISTGSTAKRLDVEGEDGRNIFNLKSREDTVNIINYIKSEKPGNAVIIGGGYIGMEICEAMKSCKMEVTLLHQLDLPLEGLELETRERVVEELQKNNVNFVRNIRVEAFQKDSTDKVQHVLTNQGPFKADIILLSLGVKPNVDLAKSANIRIGRNGGIIVDARQQTNIEDIYACGDCCEVKNIVTGKPMFIPLATLASRTARIAGENAAGGRGVFSGAVRALAFKLFGLEVAQAGIGSGEAKKYNFNFLAQSVNCYTKESMMPDRGKITVKMIIDRRTKRLLGINIFGGEGVVSRANIFSVAIQNKMTVEEIKKFDLIYSPHFSPLWDPVLVAANQVKI